MREEREREERVCVGRGKKALAVVIILVLGIICSRSTQSGLIWHTICCFSFSVSITSTAYYYVVTGTVYQLNDLSNRSSTAPPGPTGVCLFPVQPT